MKTCTGCGEPKPEVGTGANKYRCKACRATYERELRRRKNIKPKVKAEVSSTHKTCLDCHKRLPHSEFSKSQRGSGGVSSYCKKCFKIRYYSVEKSREYTQRYRTKNKERWRALHRLHQFKRRTQQTVTDDGTITDEALKELYETKKCYYCGEDTDKKDRTVDHKQPLSRDGQHTLSNIVMACSACNTRKGAKTEEEFKETMNDYSS